MPVLTETPRKTDLNPNPPRLAFGDVTVDIESRRLRTPTGVSHLEPQTFDLLLTLVERPGLTVSREHLIETVWSGDEGSGAALNLAMDRLRDALDDDVRAPRYVETVPWLGYRWIYQEPARVSARRWNLGPVWTAAGAMLSLALGGAARDERPTAEPRSFIDR